MASLLQSVLAWVMPVLLIGGSISLPRYRHAHSGGEVVHLHTSQDDHHHHAGHSHSHSHDQDDRAGARIAHLHVALLWFDFTLPTSEDADPSDPGETKSIPVVVQAASGWLSIAHDSSHPATGDWAGLHSVATNTARFGFAQADAPQVASSNLLCDSARRERSGVRRC